MSEANRPFDETEQQDIPQGFRMALAQNSYAAQYFENLPPVDQMKIIEMSKNASSEQEMDDIVGRLISH